MMNKSLMIIVVLACLCLSAAFKPSIRAPAALTTRKLQLSAKAKGSAATEEGTEYWQGEWVCADCGYIYDREFDGGGLYFEQQKRGFICPQCSAPRKRYAKKVGDQWGVTRDGGDFPIYAFSFLGLAVTTWFALVVVPSL